MNHLSNEELCDMLKCYYKTDGNARHAAVNYGIQYPNRYVPHYTYFSKLNKKIREKGTFKRSTRRVPNNEDLEINVLALFNANPRTSIKSVGRELNVSVGLVHKILKKHKYKPYKIRLVQNLHEGDNEKRIQFCQTLLGRRQEDPGFLKKILWTDEASFSTSGIFNRRNTNYWSQEQPNMIQPIERQKRSTINVWAGLVDRYIIGPFFFEGTLTSQRYIHFLQNELPNLLLEKGLTYEQIVFQHDGAPPHSTNAVTEYLNENFEIWIGLRASEDRGNIKWSPRSPDLSPLDYSVWGIIKNKVYSTPLDNLMDLRQKITNAINSLTEQEISNIQNNLTKRLQLCLQQGGNQFEHLMG